MFIRDAPHPGGIMEKLTAGKYRGIKARELEVRTVRNPTTLLTTIYVRIPPAGAQ